MLGKKRLQALTSTDVDRLYATFKETMSGTSAHHVHVVLGSCLSAAVRAKIIPRSPIADAAKTPKISDFDHLVLDEADLGRLVAGFLGSPLYPIVAVAAYTGARLREILALRWQDVDLDAKTISIVRAFEEGPGWRAIKRPRRRAAPARFRSTAASPACCPSCGRSTSSSSPACRTAPGSTCRW